MADLLVLLDMVDAAVMEALVVRTHEFSEVKVKEAMVVTEVTVQMQALMALMVVKSL